MITSFIELKNVSFSYPQAKNLFENISLTFNLDEYVAIIGRNGVGKTTLAKLIIGILRPNSGEVLINDQLTKDKSIADIAQVIGFVYQNPNQMLFTQSVEKELELSIMKMKLSKKEKNKRINKTLEFFNMHHLKKIHPRNLSRGEKQKLALATVLIQEPFGIILDEPFSGIDATQQLQILNYISKLKAQGKLVIIITHNLDLVLENCDRIISMDNGKIIHDLPTLNFFSKEENFKKIDLEKTGYLNMIYSLHKNGLSKNILKKRDLVNFFVNKFSDF